METGGGDGSDTGSVTKKDTHGRPVSVPASPDYWDKEESDINTARWRTPALVPQRRTFLTHKRGTLP